MKSLADLSGKNIVVFDLEIKKPIEQCSKGWASHDEMGISVACLFDYREMRFRVFMDDNLPAMVERLNEANTLVVAFNHIAFDNKVIRGSGLPLKPDAELRNYDMLLVSRKGAGVSNRGPGFKLDEHLDALKLPRKTADGALAPEWWQQGKVGTTVDYCLSDVDREKALFEHMYAHGTLACRYMPKPYSIEMPEFS